MVGLSQRYMHYGAKLSVSPVTIYRESSGPEWDKRCWWILHSEPDDPAWVEPSQTSSVRNTTGSLGDPSYCESTRQLDRFCGPPGMVELLEKGNQDIWSLVVQGKQEKGVHSCHSHHGCHSLQLICYHLSCFFTLCWLVLKPDFPTFWWRSATRPWSGWNLHNTLQFTQHFCFNHFPQLAKKTPMFSAKALNFTSFFKFSPNCYFFLRVLDIRINHFFVFPTFTSAFHSMNIWLYTYFDCFKTFQSFWLLQNHPKTQTTKDGTVFRSFIEGFSICFPFLAA